MNFKEKKIEMNSETNVRTLFISVGIVLLIVLAGCAPGTQEPPQTPGGGGQAVTDTAPPQDTPSEDRVLKVSAFPIKQTDPAKISSDSEVLIANHVYDYLVDVNANNDIIPRLAKDWTRSEDGLVYTFQLEEGVTFHDGSKFSAQDVVWTYRRLRDTEGLPTADLYANIESIEAISEYEVEFTLKDTNPFFLYDLSDNHALMMKAGTENPEDFNGTGPFMVEEYNPEDRMIMKANPDYFMEDKPKLSGLTIIFFNEEAAAADALQSGQIDLTMDLTTPLYESLSQKDGLKAYDIATNQFAVVRLRTDIEPGNNPKVVQAFKLATNRQAIFEVVQQGSGAPGRDSPIGPLFSDYYTEEPPLPERNPEIARELLAEAGYEDGLDVELNLLDTLNFPDLAVVLKEQWSEAGINAEIVTLPESVYYGEGKWLEVPLGITGWGHRPYPQYYLDVMLECGAKWNETRFCDERVDELIQTAGTTLNEQDRIDAYHEIQRIMVERGPMIVPYFFAEYGVIQDDYAGFELKAFSGRTDLSAVYLEK